MPEIISRFEHLGVKYPPPDWGVAWELVRARCTAAVNIIREDWQSSGRGHDHWRVFGYVPRAARLRATAVSYSSPVIRTTPIRKPVAAFAWTSGFDAVGFYPLYDSTHRHSGVPLLDMRQQDSARRVAGIGLGLRWCPVVDRCRELGATDEPRLGGGQVDQGAIAGGERVTMSLVTTDPPHLRPKKHNGLFSVSVGEVEQVKPHSPRVPGVEWNTRRSCEPRL